MSCPTCSRCSGLISLTHTHRHTRTRVSLFPCTVIHMCVPLMTVHRSGDECAHRLVRHARRGPLRRRTLRAGHRARRVPAAHRIQLRHPRRDRRCHARSPLTSHEQHYSTVTCYLQFSEIFIAIDKGAY